MFKETTVTQRFILVLVYIGQLLDYRSQQETIIANSLVDVVNKCPGTIHCVNEA